MKPSIDLTHRLVLSFDAPISSSEGCVRIRQTAAPRSAAIIAAGVVLTIFPLAAWLSTRSLAPLTGTGAALLIVIALIGVAVTCWGLRHAKHRWQLTFLSDAAIEYQQNGKLSSRVPSSSMAFTMSPCVVVRQSGLWRGWLLSVSWPEQELALSMHKKRELVEAYAKQLQSLANVSIRESNEVRHEKEWFR